MKIDYDSLGYHPESEKLVDLMSAKTQNPNRGFFRVLVPYYWSLVAAAMHAKITGFGEGTIPINYYGINLAPSGTGKGVSQGIMEKQVLNSFKDVFLNETFIVSAEQNLMAIATKRAVRNGTDQKEELIAVRKHYALLGAPVLWFDSAGSAAAIKQYRHKILMTGCGAINFCIDEIGANLVGQSEPLNLYLELYDHGLSKEKLIKSTRDESRAEIIEGATPTNLLMFGAQSKLLDAGATEKSFFDMLEMGYARRCFVSIVEDSSRIEGVSVDDLYAQLVNSASALHLDQLSTRLSTLARAPMINTHIIIEEAEAKFILQYRIDCEARARGLKESETIRKVEMDNRFFKTLKLAGAYAFIDGSPKILREHVEYAIRLSEDSGKAFEKLITPVRPYVKFAKHLAEHTGEEFTFPDLEEDLPYFRGGRNQKDELIAMATAWAYKNGIIIKKRFDSGIQFIRGETLEATTLDKLTVSYSPDIAANYVNQHVSWQNLKQLLGMKDYNWINHHLKHGYHDGTAEFKGAVRRSENIIKGFNLIAIDVDKGMPLATAQILLKEYTYLIHTTKRHRIDSYGDRYRIIIPTNFQVKLDDEDFKIFMNNLATFLPIPIDSADTQTFQPARKWSTTNNCQIFENEGSLLDVLPFIPRTAKEQERKEYLKQYSNLDSMERWFVDHTGEGNRNNQLYNFAAMLAETGYDLSDITQKVMSLNDKLPNKLEQGELMKTVISSVARKIQN